MKFWLNIILPLLILNTLISASPLFRDNSDQIGWFTKRSNMRIYTDHLTSVQYVRTGFFGGTSVRVDADGKPIIK